jgi:hypothetical protein
MSRDPTVGGVVLSCCGLLFAPATTIAQLLFQPSHIDNFAPGEVAVRMDTGDVDGDGYPDLVSISGGAPALLTGNGVTGFDAPSPLAVGISGEDLRLADLDGDLDADLMVVSAAESKLHVLLADGTGGFGPAASIDLSATPTKSVVDRDVDGDGDIDAIVVAPDDVRFFLNDGAGRLTPGPEMVDFLAGFPFLGAIPASLNGDDFPDLVISKGVQSDPRSDIYLGQDGGGWAWTQHLSDAEVHAVGDLDGDGDLDLIETSHHLLQSVEVRSHLNAGDGTLTPGPQTDLQFGVAFGTDLDLQQLDDDGLADLVVVNSDDFVPPGPEAWMLAGDGRGAFSMPGARVTLTQTSSVTLAWVGPCTDIDMDGRLDVSALIAPLGATRLAVMMNSTYRAGGPLLDLGHQLSSTATGYPVQCFTGAVAAGGQFTIDLLSGPKGKFTNLLVVGLSVLDAPFKGGTLVPNPFQVLGPFLTDFDGHVAISPMWPLVLPSGVQIVTQFWFPAPAVAGFAATSGLLITTP